MSANNAIFINKKNFKVYEHGCMDNPFEEKTAYLIGKGKNLAEAISIAEKYTDDTENEGSYIEYGIHFYGN